MINRSFTWAFMVLLAAMVASCDTGIRSSSLVINRIVDEGPTPSIVYVALSRKPNFFDGFKEYSAIYDFTSGNVPAITFSDIVWSPEYPDQKSAEFWLLVADDSSAGNIGFLGLDDRLLPAMRVILRDGEQTTIDEIIFNRTASTPSGFLSVPTTPIIQHVRLFLEDPARLPSATLRLRIGTSNNLTAPGYEFPITSPELTSAFQFLVTSTNTWFGLAWLDLESDGNLDPEDWISAPIDDAPLLGSGNTWILHSGP